MSSGLEWQFHIATDCIVVKNGTLHIGIDILW